LRAKIEQLLSRPNPPGSAGTSSNVATAELKALKQERDVAVQGTARMRNELKEAREMADKLLAEANRESSSRLRASLAELQSSNEILRSELALVKEEHAFYAARHLETEEKLVELAILQASVQTLEERNEYLAKMLARKTADFETRVELMGRAVENTLVRFGQRAGELPLPATPPPHPPSSGPSFASPAGAGDPKVFSQASTSSSPAQSGLAKWFSGLLGTARPKNATLPSSPGIGFYNNVKEVTMENVSEMKMTQGGGNFGVESGDSKLPPLQRQMSFPSPIHSPINSDKAPACVSKEKEAEWEKEEILIERQISSAQLAGARFEGSDEEVEP
jgi:hypothetical protein